MHLMVSVELFTLTAVEQLLSSQQGCTLVSCADSTLDFAHLVQTGIAISKKYKN